MERKQRKKLPTPFLIILTLLFVVLLILLGICVGFIINSILLPGSDDLDDNIHFTLLVSFVYMVLLIILMRNSDNENVKPLNWYINNVLISFAFVLVMAAIVVFIPGPEQDSYINYIVGYAMLPLVGIMITPNIVIHYVKDTAKWKKILYDNGNLHEIKKSNDYYRVEPPVPFEKKLLFAVYKNHILNVLCIVVVSFIIIYAGIHYIVSDKGYTDNFIHNIIQVRSNRVAGYGIFLAIASSVFTIPLVAYHITIRIKRFRLIRNHKYLAYHAIVSGVHNSKIAICNKHVHYKFNYCTCVGINEKDVKNTKATLVFLPDDVYLFPDDDDYKVNKYKKTK